MLRKDAGSSPLGARDYREEASMFDLLIRAGTFDDGIYTGVRPDGCCGVPTPNSQMRRSGNPAVLSATRHAQRSNRPPEAVHHDLVQLLGGHETFGHDTFRFCDH